MPRLAGARLLLFTAVVALGLDAADGKQRKKFRRRELADGASADSAAPLPLSPTHDVRCGGRACRPGEGNLKGYQHWSQPYKHVPVKLADTYGSPPGWRRRSDPFPSHRYASLVEVAKSRLRDNFVLLCAADFDFRLLALNWYRAAAKAGWEPPCALSVGRSQPSRKLAPGGRGEPPRALARRRRAVLPARSRRGDQQRYRRAQRASRSRRCATLLPRFTSAAAPWSLQAWVDPTSRLRRHIQRALAERHMAAAALVKAGSSGAAMKPPLNLL